MTRNVRGDKKRGAGKKKELEKAFNHTPVGGDEKGEKEALWESLTTFIMSVIFYWIEEKSFCRLQEIPLHAIDFRVWPLFLGILSFSLSIWTTIEKWIAAKSMVSVFFSSSSSHSLFTVKLNISILCGLSNYIDTELQTYIRLLSLLPRTVLAIKDTHIETW